MDILKEKKSGERKGKEENQKQVILNMYKKNMSIEDICDIAELSKKEVERIIKENRK